jgi:geranylgeranyl pyrophosphate synthase
MRYGRATLHVERGLPSALNAGDYLLGAGYRIVTALPGVAAEPLRDVVAILADAHVRLAKGQGAELWWRDAAGRRLSAAEALAIYGLKTSPAFEGAIAMGIRLAGVAPAAAAAIDRYALHVGTGFQVLNDLKDWEGDLENDRRAAGDLLGGRPTLLWALALESLSEVDLTRLRTIAVESARSDLTGSEAAALLDEARGLYVKAGVVPRARAVAAEQRRLAGEAIAGCRMRRLRDVLEFLLDLAVPETAESP